VLLIIFMVTAPHHRVARHADGFAQKRQREALQTGVSRSSSRQTAKHASTPRPQRRRRHRAAGQESQAKTKDLRAVIRADKKVEHGRVIHVLDLLRRSGIAKIAFAVTPSAEAVPAPTLEPKK